jgi:hypothetical protein
MEAPPHAMRLGDEQDYYVKGPELLRERLPLTPVSKGSGS